MGQSKSAIFFFFFLKTLILGDELRM